MANINTYTESLDMEFWKDFFKMNGKMIKLNKGETFACEGITNSKVGFVIDGYFKYTVNDNDGNEHITGFAFKNSFVGDYTSAIYGNTSITNIIAVTNSTILICNREIIQSVFTDDKNAHIKLVESLFHQIYTTYINCIRLSPKERYIQIITNCPEILQDIPLKELASFLKITPTYLSKIRKEITFK